MSPGSCVKARPLHHTCLHLGRERRLPCSHVRFAGQAHHVAIARETDECHHGRRVLTRGTSAARVWAPPLTAATMPALEAEKWTSSPRNRGRSRALSDAYSGPAPGRCPEVPLPCVRIKGVGGSGALLYVDPWNDMSPPCEVSLSRP